MQIPRLRDMHHYRRKELNLLEETLFRKAVLLKLRDVATVKLSEKSVKVTISSAKETYVRIPHVNKLSHEVDKNVR
jgi:hypothetical protein